MPVLIGPERLYTRRVMSEETAAKERPESFWTRLPVMVLMALVLVAAGLLSAITAMRFTIRGQEVEVPALVGVVEADAGDRLAASGLELMVDSRRFSETVPEGYVLDQNPPSGVRVKRDRRVRVRVSLGPRQYAVPEVAGASLRSGQLMLGQRGFGLGSTLYAHTDTGEASTIVFQKPEPGSTSYDEPAVSVLVSLGSIDQYYLMPNLTGRNAQQVVGRIRQEGFRLGQIVYTRDSEGPSGRILGQDPAPGERISTNDTLFLEVSQ
jgi:beta-lactam-binding protein with PASTA domain